MWIVCENMRVGWQIGVEVVGALDKKPISTIDNGELLLTDLAFRLNRFMFT